MPDVTLTHGATLDTVIGLRSVSTTNALSAVKLFRLRKLLQEEADAIVAAFDELGQRHACRDDLGAPVVQVNDAQEPLLWKLTGTPFYQLTDKPAFDAESQALFAEAAVLTVPVRLLEKDLETMTLSADVAGLLDPFVTGL